MAIDPKKPEINSDGDDRLSRRRQFSAIRGEPTRYTNTANRKRDQRLLELAIVRLLRDRTVKNVSELREDYVRGTLEISDVLPDPTEQFRVWFQNASDQGLPEPNAMSLATATADGRPSARIVLLKGFDDRGFAFFTNYRSRKSRELNANPFAALLFYYPVLERQIRLEGRVEVLSSEESDTYYLSRPIGSRLGAWASNQSEVVADRSILDQRIAELEKRAITDPFPRPPHWGGFRVIPDVFEFWQGRHNRMHDRIRYRLTADGWVIERLEP